MRPGSWIVAVGFALNWALLGFHYGIGGLVLFAGWVCFLVEDVIRETRDRQ